MAHPFGVSQVTDYLTQMGLKIARVDNERELVELAFHGDHGQWRMIVGFQQNGTARKLMLIVPHIGIIAATRRLECLEALMAVNYRIAIGKFGVDLDDGEVRLEEAIPVGSHHLTFEQFQMVFGALLQTVAMYHSLLPRIVYGNLSVNEALQSCEQEFLHQAEQDNRTESTTIPLTTEQGPSDTHRDLSEVSIHDVLAEVTRIFEENRE